MSTCIIYNPTAGTNGEDVHLAEHARASGWTLVRTRGPGDATALAREALEAGNEQIVVAGGDGTINEVVQAFADDWGAAVLGVVPLGTGNDFARALNIPLDPVDALTGLGHAQELAIDVIKADAEDRGPRYAVNMSAGGFTGEVDQVVSPDMKSRWGPLTYIRGAAEAALPTAPRFDVRIEWDDGPTEHVEVLNVVVANGSTAAGGHTLAPGARVDDGLLDVVIVHASGALDLVRIAAELAKGDYTEHPAVSVRRTRRLRVRATPNMWFNVDGELYSNQPIAFDVCQGVLRVARPLQIAAGRS